MKKIYILAGLLFLASCGQAEIQETVQNEVPATPETVVEEVLDEVIETTEDETPSEEINAEVEALETAVEDTTKTVTVDASYTNPKGNVDMMLDYTLDSEGKIETIGVSATTYDVANFNDEIQTLVGSTISEAAEYTSGSSLTGEAFKKAVKTQLK